MIAAEVVADSIARGASGWHRCSTLRLRYPLAFHAEILRHRVLSHSVRSARAVPLAAQIEAVRRGGWVPAEWPSAQRGMQGGPPLAGWRRAAASGAWRAGALVECGIAAFLGRLGVHQQHAARRLSSDAWVDDLVTGETWGPMLALRDHPAAQPEAQELARAIRAALEGSRPRELSAGEWHLPLALPGESSGWAAIDLSAARCARTSYHGHDGRPRPVGDDLELARRLRGAGHWSPYEHQRQAPPLAAPLLGPGTRWAWARWSLDVAEPAPEPGWLTG